MAPVRRVRISRWAAKQMERLPRHIQRNLLLWIHAVEHDGLEETRKVPGYHDEPLRGTREGQRSIRLSREYRLVYEYDAGRPDSVSIKEVSKHYA